jgi:hypothetical protein
MSAASQHPREEPAKVTEKGLFVHVRRGLYFYAFIAVVTIAVSTMLALVLIQLIAAAR